MSWSKIEATLSNIENREESEMENYVQFMQICSYIKNMHKK